MFVIDSAATSREEIGNPPHRGTVNKLGELGIPSGAYRARQVTLDDYDKFDYIIGMDTANIRNLNRMLNHDPEGSYKLLSFAGSGRDIADPWYTGDFDETYRDVEEGIRGVSELSEKKREKYRNLQSKVFFKLLLCIKIWYNNRQFLLSTPVPHEKPPN